MRFRDGDRARRCWMRLYKLLPIRTRACLGGESADGRGCEQEQPFCASDVFYSTSQRWSVDEEALHMTTAVFACTCGDGVVVGRGGRSQNVGL